MKITMITTRTLTISWMMGLLLFFTQAVWAQDIDYKACSEKPFIPELPTTSQDDLSWPFIQDEGQQPDYIFAWDLSRKLSVPITYKKTKKDSLTLNGRKYPYKVKNIKPKVGKSMVIALKGQSSPYDSVVYNGSYASYYLEDQDTFTNAIEVNLEIAEDTSNKKGIELQITFTLLDVLKKMHDNYSRYYSYLQKHYISEMALQADRTYINERLAACIALNSFTSKALEQQLKTLANADKEKYRPLIESISRLYQGIMDYTNIVTLPEQIENEDAFQLTFDFYKNSQKKASKSYTYATSGGFKIDFSTGFLYSKLIDHEFKIVSALNNEISIDSVSSNGSLIRVDTLTKKVIRENSGNFKVGMAVLSHFYTRTGTFVNVGGTAGITLNSDADPQYLAGFSLMFNGKGINRLVLSGGWAFGKVDRLSNKYARNQPEAPRVFTNVNDSELTTKQWQHNCFFSLTYNLSQSKDSQE